MSERAGDLVDAVRTVLAENADPDKAVPMRAYMKSEMPFLGVSASLRRKLCRKTFKQYPLVDSSIWTATVLSLWRSARYREERYAAIQLAGLKQYDAFRTPDCIPMLEEMIVSGAWWDYVDEIAVRQIGWYLDRFPNQVTPVVLHWSTDANLWKRRTSIICQVLRRERTDTDLLTSAIIPSIDSSEFFLRKAIGWALRAHSLIDPQFVRAFVASHESRLSGLSRREALRRIDNES